MADQPTRRGRGGQPTKLTPERTERLLQAIRAGNYYDAACAYAGIGYSTFREWIVRGEKAKTGKYAEFAEAVKKAELDAETRLVAQWQQHMPEDWKAIATFLERRHPDKWGRRDRVAATVEHSGQVTSRHEYDITQTIIMDPAAAEAAEQLLRRATGISHSDTGALRTGSESRDVAAIRAPDPD